MVTWTALTRLTVTETKLFLREPTALTFGIVFPTVLLLGLGAIPMLRQASPEFGGVRFVDSWAPSALVLGLGVLAIQHLPATLATYREQGVLRRLSITPVHPAMVLVAQLIVVLAASLCSAGLLVVAAWAVLDVTPPEHPGWFLLTLLIGCPTLLAIGLLIAAVTPTARAANGVSTLVYMLLMAIGGVFLPRFMLPDVLVRLGEVTPPGAQALLDSWSGEAGTAISGQQPQGADPTQLAIMAVVAVVIVVIAAKLFRWE